MVASGRLGVTRLILAGPRNRTVLDTLLGLTPVTAVTLNTCSFQRYSVQHGFTLLQRWTLEVCPKCPIASSTYSTNVPFSMRPPVCVTLYVVTTSAGYPSRSILNGSFSVQTDSIYSREQLQTTRPYVTRAVRELTVKVADITRRGT